MYPYIKVNLFKRAKCFLLTPLLLLFLSSCDIHKAMPSAVESDRASQVFNIGFLNLTGHLPLGVLVNNDDYQLLPFKINPIQKFDWHELEDVMKSGELDGTFILWPQAMELIQKGFPGKIVLVANRSGNRVVLSDKIKTISDLNNHQYIIAVPHIYSQHHILLNIFLGQHGILKDNIQLVEMPPIDMPHYLNNGAIDGFVAGQPIGNNTIKDNLGWLAATSEQLWSGHIDHVFLVSNTFIQTHPDELHKLINQLVSSGKLIDSSPKKAKGIAQTGNYIWELSNLTAQKNWITFDNMVASEAEMVSMAQHLIDMQLWSDVPHDLSLNYFDMSFAHKAVQNHQGTEF